MQDSHYKLGIIIPVLLTPILLYAVLQILPTHDDWASMTTPDFRPFFIKERFLFYGYHWRPFDSMIGYVAGRNPQLLFPTFNHLLVVAGHLLCTITLFRLLSELRFSLFSKNITTICFFVLPATMATVLAVDSQNQVFALTCDMIAFLCYIKLHRARYLVWILLIFLATLFKENGLMWALICPILAFGFDFIDQKTLKKDLLIAVGIMVCYMLVIVITPKDIVIHPDYEPGVMKVIGNVVKFLFTTFVTVDYVYLLHAPSRQLLWAVLSLLLTLPFLYLIWVRNWRKMINKKILCTLICLVIAVGPHLLTVFSMMHTYAGLSLLAIIIAYGIDLCKPQTKKTVIAFIVFLTASLAIDAHLINESIKSGLVGQKMAKEAIQKTGHPIKSAYVIIIEDDYPKLSSFCVIPVDAFGWGIAAQYETNYQWPKEIQDTTIERSADAMKRACQMAKTSNCESVWIVDHQDITVINNLNHP